MRRERRVGSMKQSVNSIFQGTDRLFASRGKTIQLLLLFSIVLIVFGNSLLNGFIWDDNIYTTGNAVYKDFDIRKILVTPANGVEYLPVRDLTIALDFLVWRGNPAGFHLTNLILYLLNVLIAYFLAIELCRLLAPDDKGGDDSPSRLIALVTALLFAVHPIHSEVVNFVTCRNALLSGFFFLAAYLYLKFLRLGNDKRYPYYIGALACFILALLSKATVIILPVILMLFTAYSRRREKRRELLYTIPFFLLAVAAYLLHTTIATKVKLIGEDVIAAAGPNVAAKVAMALQIPFFYLSKIFLLNGFSASYGIDFSESFGDPHVIAAMFALAVLFGMAFLFRKRYPQVLFGLLFFWITLIPVLHLLPTNPIVADRYAYLPSYGVFFLLAVSLTAVRGNMRRTAIVIGTILALTWSFVSYGQNKVWKSGESLWENAIKIKPTAYAYNNLAAFYYDKGELEKSIEISAKALELEPLYAEHDFYRGLFSFNNGDPLPAIQLFNSVLFKVDNHIRALFYLGRSYESIGRPDKAIESYFKILTVNDREQDPTNVYRGNADSSLKRLWAGFSPQLDRKREKVLQNPEDRNALKDLAFTLHTLALYPEALVRYGELEKRGAGNWQLCYNVALVHEAMKNDQEAARYYEKSLSMNPWNVDALNNLGLLYRKAGDLERARRTFEKAVAIDKHFAFAPYNLAVTFFMMGDRETAIRYFTYTQENFPALAVKVSPYLKAKR